MNTRVMRQVQLIVGIMILTGSALTHWVTPYGLILCAIAGAGLLQASLTGLCPMENILARMPWNKAPKNAGCGCEHNECGAK